MERKDMTLMAFYGLVAIFFFWGGPQLVKKLVEFIRDEWRKSQ